MGFLAPRPTGSSEVQLRVTPLCNAALRAARDRRAGVMSMLLVRELVWTKSTLPNTLSRVKTVTTHEAKTHLSRLVAEVEAGEEIVIRRGARAVARLVPLGRAKRATRPKVGTITSPPIRARRGVFEALSDEDLKEWGL
ncbi:MAG: type II toxin-antitoxin system Phd/YefM family antitoxin [Candidatus Binatia bacterium]|jgi:antitoxin (DNA-binding transcriptional repressor) of toxin-antitoxin stability system